LRRRRYKTSQSQSPGQTHGAAPEQQHRPLLPLFRRLELKGRLGLELAAMALRLLRLGERRG
jgi:hypothetical protein